MSKSRKRPKGSAAGARPLEAGKSKRERFADIRRSTVAIALIPRDLGERIQRHGNPGEPGRPLAPISIIGTGFKVAEPNIFLTAKHVVQGWIESARSHAAAGTLPDKMLSALIVFPPSRTESGNPAWLYGMTPMLGVVMSNTEDAAAFHIHPTLQDGSPHIMRPLQRAATPCEEGDEVATCGFPFGLNLHQDQLDGVVVSPSFSQGIVSAALPFPAAPRELKTVFQLDAMINGGNSGGPVFDVRTGHVVGITSSALQLPVVAPNVEQQLGSVIARVPTGIARALYIHRVDEMISEAIRKVPEWRPQLRRP